MIQSPAKRLILGVQFLFVAFGATVLVPLLVGIDPSVALFTAGVGTLIFHLITGGKVPVFLGSSFAFIAPIVASTELYGMPGTLAGLMAVGLVYATVSAFIKLLGPSFIVNLFPSVVVGPVIMVIGLSLSSVAVDMAKGNWLLAIIVLAAAIITVIFAKGMFRLIPILVGLVVGYIAATLMGAVDFTAIHDASWIALPEFVKPEWNLKAILFLLPVAVAPMIEHVGDMYAIGGVAKQDFVKDPGLHRTLLGDGIATFIAGIFGGPPNTTYSEVTGAVSLTKVTDPRVLRISACTAIAFSFIGKIAGALKTIPVPVLGGIMLLLFGMIACVGIKILIDSHTNLNHTRNQVIVSIVLAVGIGGASLSIKDFTLSGIGLASVVGVILNLILPGHSEEVEATDEEDIVI
ncbi:uracil-xanthine permease family protein [Kiritimatiellaeota bacterium B1221]|nr:uracil-xanthine permease family protein [Kiritimatiellaeota bacterium B1221]